MRKVIMTTVFASALLLGSSTMAFAGEYNGKGEAVPGGHQGKSECSFSGLDIPDDVEGNPPGYDDDPMAYDYHGVQSYGQFVSLGMKEFLPSPGMACNPSGHRP